MSREVMHVLDGLGLLVRPLAGPHVAEALKMGAFLYRERRRMNLADQDSGFQKLHLLARGDRALDLSITNHGAGGDDALDDGMFCDYEGALGVNLTFEAAIDPDRAIERHHAVEGDVSAEEGEVLAFALALWFLAVMVPHHGFPCGLPARR